MSAISDAAAAILVGLHTVPDVQVTADPGATIRPSALVLGPPSMEWQAYGAGLTSARFLVYVVVDADERALERLWELVPQAAAALDELQDVTVIRADPGTYLTGGVELPCYEITTEVSI